MAEREVQFKLTADAKEVVEELKKIVDSAKKTGAETEGAFGGIKEAAKTVSIVIAGINQATELVRKGMDALKQSIVGPLENLKGLVNIGGNLVREFEKATGTITETGKKLNDLDRNLVLLRSSFGEVIANTPEFSTLLDVLNKALVESSNLLSNNLPAATKLFGAAVQVVATSAAASIAKIGAAFEVLRNHVDGVIETLKRFNIISDPIDDTVDAVRELAGTFRFFSDVAGDEFEQAQVGLDEMADKLEEAAKDGKLLGSELGPIRDRLKEIGESSAFEGVGEGVVENLQAILDVIDPIADRLVRVEGAIGAADTATQGWKDAFAALAPGAAKVLEDLISGLRNLGNTKVDVPEFTGGTARVNVDDAELKRLQDEMRKADQRFNILRQNLEDGVKPKFEGNIAELAPQFTEIGQKINEVGAALLELGPDLNGVTQGWIGFGDAAKDALAESGSAGFSDAITLVEAYRNEIDALGDAAPAVKTKFEDLVDTLKTLRDAAAQKIEVEVESTGGGGTGNVEQKAAIITEASSEAAGEIRESADVLTSAAEDSGQALDDAAAAQQDAANAGNAAAAALAQSATSLTTAADLGSSAARAIDLAADGLQGAAQSVKAAGDAFAGILKGGSDAEAGALVKAAGDLSGSARALDDAAGAIVSAANRLQAPPKQLGGVVTSGPQVVTVGESGPELILPLNSRGVGFLHQLSQGQGSGGGFGAAGISVVVSGNTFIGFEDLAQLVERRIADRLQSVEVRV